MRSEQTEGQTRDTKRRMCDATGQAVLNLTFFTLFFLYLWQVVDLRLIYSIGATTNFPVFFKGWGFFRDQIVPAGGVVTYVSALLSQLFYYAWAGALVVTLQAWLLAACTGYLLRKTGVPGSRWLRFVPPLLVLATYNQYTYHLPTATALLAVMLFACLYVAIVSRHMAGARHRDKKLRSFDGRAIALFLILSVVVYPVAAGAYLLFGALCVLYEFLSRSLPAALAALAVVLMLPYGAAVWMYNTPVVDAYTELLPLSWKIHSWSSRTHMIEAVYALYLLVPGALLLAGLRDLLLRHFRTAPIQGESERTRAPHPPAPDRWGPATTRGRARHPKSAHPPSHRLFRPTVMWTAQALITLGSGATIAAVSHNSQQKTLLAVHYYACHRMWPQVLRAAAGQPTNPFVLNAVNQALYHTGRLGSDMFTYAQQPRALLATGDDKTLVYWNKFDALIDLGLMNLAEKNLTECMETFGEHPMILQRLALVNMVRGRTDTARVFLGALDRTLFHGAWARHYLTLLQSDPALSTDARIQQMRTVCLRTDSIASFFGREQMLAALLTDNSRNRMAFEYLMAWYLVTKQVGKVVEGLRYLDDLDYAEIPRLYQEAICVYAYGRRQDVPLFGRTISPDVQQQIERFTQIYNRYKRDKGAAFPELAAAFRGTYFLYQIYGLTPRE